MISLKEHRLLRIWKLNWTKHKRNSKTDNSEETEEANGDKTTTAEAKASNKTEIFLKEEQKTQAF